MTQPDQSGKPFHVETLTSRKAAERLGVNVQKFLRIAAANHVSPVLEAPGLRGAKFWNPRDIERLADELTNGGAAAS